jgi:hypothetical protein
MYTSNVSLFKKFVENLPPKSSDRSLVPCEKNVPFLLNKRLPLPYIYEHKEAWVANRIPKESK